MAQKKSIYFLFLLISFLILMLAPVLRINIGSVEFSCDFIHCRFICFLTGERRLFILVGGGGETGAASEMLPDQRRRSDWGGSSRVEGLYIPARNVPEPGEKR